MLRFAGSNATPAYSPASVSLLPARSGLRSFCARMSLAILQSGLPSPSRIRHLKACHRLSLSGSVDCCSVVCHVAYSHLLLTSHLPHTKQHIAEADIGDLGVRHHHLRRIMARIPHGSFSRTIRPRNNPYCSSPVERIAEECTITLVCLSGLLRGRICSGRDLAGQSLPLSPDSSGLVGTHHIATNEN